MPALVPDAAYINSLSNGDVGLAEQIISPLVDSLLAGVPSSYVQSFIDSMLPKSGVGLKAFEKTLISSMLETHKPLIDLSKALLELMATAEGVLVRLSGGPNPATVNGTFSKSKVDAGSGQDGPDAFPGDAAIAGTYFTSSFLDVVTNRVKPAIAAITKILNDPSGFLTEVVQLKLSEHFDIFKSDDTLAHKDGVFLLDGGASVKILGVDVGFSFVDGKFGSGRGNGIEQPMLKSLLGFLKLPFDVLKAILEYIGEFLAKVVSVAALPQAIEEFTSFSWLTDILDPKNLLKLLGLEGNKSLIGTALSTPDTLNKLIEGVLQTVVDLPTKIFGLDLGIKVTI